ncbi:MAG TPA: dihydropteroate synthase [Nitrospiraceae bacterium]|nr:dihydropteroate synthase [Nitrospiraceae bacterium]
MGILNITPDSFSDGGLYLNPDAAVARAHIMVEQGADLIDIGAESSRPGSDPIEENEELSRLIPVVREVCRNISIPVSVDTTKARVAQEALDAGAAIINDISALRYDPRMCGVVARYEAALVLMHMQGTPKNMQRAPRYANIVEEVLVFFRERVQAAVEAGISTDRILLDPGIGFGKNLDHNLTLIAQLKTLTTLGRPILVGPSRKGFIGRVLDRPVHERLMGTAAVIAIAVVNGARLIRVHDVDHMRDVVTMVEAIMSHRQSVTGPQSEAEG